MFNLNNRNKGFTLIEIIVAILVVTIGVLAAYVVTQEIISYTHRISSRLTAAYLAQEGIEIVRNIRDANWLQEEGWNDGLAGVGPDDWEADYTTRTFIDSGGAGEDCSVIPYYNCEDFDPNNYLRINGDFYNYISGNPTKFKRRIRISDIEGNNLTVTVSVWWEEKGKTYGPVTVQEILYDWKNPL